jgi:hypothetical protein
MTYTAAGPTSTPRLVRGRLCTAPQASPARTTAGYGIGIPLARCLRSGPCQTRVRLTTPLAGATVRAKTSPVPAKPAPAQPYDRRSCRAGHGPWQARRRDPGLRDARRVLRAARAATERPTGALPPRLSGRSTNSSLVWTPCWARNTGPNNGLQRPRLEGTPTFPSDPLQPTTTEARPTRRRRGAPSDIGSSERSWPSRARSRKGGGTLRVDRGGAGSTPWQMVGLRRANHAAARFRL